MYVDTVRLLPTSDRMLHQDATRFLDLQAIDDDEIEDSNEEEEDLGPYGPCYRRLTANLQNQDPFVLSDIEDEGSSETYHSRLSKLFEIDADVLKTVEGIVERLRDKYRQYSRTSALALEDDIAIYPMPQDADLWMIRTNVSIPFIYLSRHLIFRRC